MRDLDRMLREGDPRARRFLQLYATAVAGSLDLDTLSQINNSMKPSRVGMVIDSVVSGAKVAAPYVLAAGVGLGAAACTTVVENHYHITVLADGNTVDGSVDAGSQPDSGRPKQDSSSDAGSTDVPSPDINIGKDVNSSLDSSNYDSLDAGSTDVPLQQDGGVDAVLGSDSGSDSFDGGDTNPFKDASPGDISYVDSSDGGSDSIDAKVDSSDATNPKTKKFQQFEVITPDKLKIPGTNNHYNIIRLETCAVFDGVQGKSATEPLEIILEGNFEALIDYMKFVKSGNYEDVACLHFNNVKNVRVVGGNMPFNVKTNIKDQVLIQAIYVLGGENINLENIYIQYVHGFGAVIHGANNVTIDGLKVDEAHAAAMICDHNSSKSMKTGKVVLRNGNIKNKTWGLYVAKCAMDTLIEDTTITGLLKGNSTVTGIQASAKGDLTLRKVVVNGFNHYGISDEVSGVSLYDQVTVTGGSSKAVSSPPVVTLVEGNYSKGKNLKVIKNLDLCGNKNKVDLDCSDQVNDYSVQLQNGGQISGKTFGKYCNNVLPNGFKPKPCK